jgi:hypothetical protein
MHGFECTSCNNAPTLLKSPDHVLLGKACVFADYDLTKSITSSISGVKAHDVVRVKLVQNYGFRRNVHIDLGYYSGCFFIVGTLFPFFLYLPCRGGAQSFPWLAIAKPLH